MMTEKDIDALIASVTREIDNAEALAKSAKKDEKPEPKNLNKADEKPGHKPAPPPADDAPPEAEAAPSDAPPSDDASAEEPPAPHDDAGMPPHDESAEGEANLSDEDLMEIYDALAPEDLERHVMIAQQVLAHKQGSMEQPGGEMPPAAAPASAPAPESMAMSEKTAGEALAKAEQTEKAIEEIKAQLGGLQKSIELVAKAMETGFKPVRKSVAGVEFTQRGDSGSDGETKSLSKAELDSKLKELVKNPNLSKSDRVAINEYYLDGKGRERVEKLVTGGK